jgi:hypothetical protein
MGFKARRRGGKTAREIVERWLADTGAKQTHVYTRSFDGVNVLLFVSGDDVDAESGLGRGVKAVIDYEITNSR